LYSLLLVSRGVASATSTLRSNMRGDASQVGEGPRLPPTPQDLL
jgi:hypothetical protein